jgi:hypothetical protein
MLIARGVIGGILLFLGRELNFLLAAAMAALLGLRLAPLLPRGLPNWADTVFIIALAILAGAIPIINQRIGYFISGFLAGAVFLVELYAPGMLTLPFLPFLVGGVIGALVLGIFTEWALIVVSSLVGAYYLMNLFTLSSTAQILVGSGLFILGALTQAILMRAQGNDHEAV